jgi:hypothetical protein
LFDESNRPLAWKLFQGQGYGMRAFCQLPRSNLAFMNALEIPGAAGQQLPTDPALLEIERVERQPIESRGRKA